MSTVTRIAAERRSSRGFAPAPGATSRSVEYRLIRSFIAYVGPQSASFVDRFRTLDARRDYDLASSLDGTLTIAVRYRGSPAAEDRVPIGRVVLVLGDDAERDRIRRGECVGNAAQIRCNDTGVEITTSIVGLPAVFLYRDRDRLVILSDPHLLTTIPDISLSFEADAVVESCVIGHPVGYKTLFTNLSIIPGGRHVSANQHATTTSVAWSLRTSGASNDGGACVDRQCEAFRDAVRRTNLSHTFFSMTAGLDTRAILAALIEQQRMNLPAYTMTAARLTVDATRARQLCWHYGLRHSIVEFGRDFVERLPEYANEASRLSGGLASVDQSHEIYFYRCLDRSFAGRLCGYLGNQVARRGTENLSMRRASPAVLHRDLLHRCADVRACDPHWYGEAACEHGHLDCEFLLQQEALFSSVANYSVGQHFAVQKSPYADSHLIESCCRHACANMYRRRVSIGRLRLQDLRHRFVGRHGSFQRDLINAVSGYVAECPINWGWLSRGGVSAPGFLQGGLALLDEATSALHPGPRTRRLLAIAGIAGRSRFSDRAAWLHRLADFVGDTLHTAVQDCRVFDRRSLLTLYDRWRSGTRMLDNTVTFALDLALAAKNFRVSL